MGRPVLSTTALVVLCSASATATLAQAPAGMDSAAIYRAACAACHGADGGGISPESDLYRNFDPPPAPLTDPLFNSREPAADWFLVIQHGGARLGLSTQMPAYSEALSDEQIADLVDYIKGLADTDRYPPGDLNFTRPIATTKAFPEDEALIINRFEDGPGDDTLRTTLYYARRFGARNHFEVKLNTDTASGRTELDEVELEVKSAVAFDLERQVIHTLGLELAVPIEDDAASEEVIPYYSVAKGLSDSVTLQGQLVAKLPVDDFDGGEATLRGVVHWIPSPWPRALTPGLELTLTEPFSAADTVATVIPQVYTGLSKGGHVAFAIGIELPLTDEAWDYRVRTFLLWDIADGPLWSGW